MAFFEKGARLLEMSTEADQLEYKKVPHSTGEGDRYEERSLALVFLRCLREGLQFALSSNDDDGGKFDDVVLRWRNKGSPIVSAMFVQLKHKTSAIQTTIRRSSLMWRKKDNKKDSKDFSIEVYHESYEKMRKSLDCGSYALILSTNIDVDEDAKDMFLERNPQSVPGMKLLDSGGCLYSLNPDNDDVKRLVDGDDRFVQSFYLFCNQSNNKSIKDKIYTELKVILGADEGYSKTMCETLCSSLREWMNTHNFYLKSNWESWLGIVDTYIKKEVTTCNSMVTRIKYSCVETLKAHIERRNPAWIRPPGQDATVLSATKVHQAVCGERHIMVSVTRLTELEERILCCWGPFCRWLVLVDEGERSYEALLRMARQSGPTRRLVIVSYEGDPSFQDTFTSGDIPDDRWKELMDVSIKLNSEQYLCDLKDLCDLEALKAMLDGKPEAVVALSQLSGPVRLGQDLDPLPTNYIPRHLTCRMCVRQEFFSSHGDKKVCIMDEMTYKSLTNKYVVKNTVKFEELENYLSASDAVWPLFVVTNNVHCSAVQMISSKYAEIHMYILSHVDDEWLHVEEQSIKLLQVVDSFSNRAIVEGKPGVGKSTMLLEMAKQLKEEHPAWWILRLDLLKYSELFDSNGSGVEASKDILLQAVYNEKNLGVLEYTLLQHCLQECPRIICLVDGFDEVCPDYAEKCLEALEELAPQRGQLVVTTRPSVTGRLEATLGVFAHSLPEFSEEQLHRFHGWSDSEIGVTDVVRDLLTIPLFSRMYLESLDSGIMVHDTVSLYEAFFEKKFRRMYEEKCGNDLSKLLYKKMIEKVRREHEKELAVLAMSYLLPKFEVPCLSQSSIIDRDDLLKAGVIYEFIDDKPVFIHRTFAEHFLAKWCFLNFADDLRANVYRSALSDSSLEFFVESFDRMASRGRPLLTAILNGSEGEVKSLLGKGADPTEEDKWGRNSLHLVAAYSRDSTILSLLVERLQVMGTATAGGSASGLAGEALQSSEAEAVTKVHEATKSVEKERTTESDRAASVLELGETSEAAGLSRVEETLGAVDPSQFVEMALGAEDALLHWTPLRYAAERQHWRAVAALLEVGARLRHLGDFQRGLHTPEELWRIFKEEGYRALFDHILGNNKSIWSSQMVEQLARDRCLQIKVGVSIVCAEMSVEQYLEIMDEVGANNSLEVGKLLMHKILDTLKKTLIVGSPSFGLNQDSSRSSQLDECRQMPLHEADLGSSIIQLLEIAEAVLHHPAERGDAESILQLVQTAANNKGSSAMYFAAFADNVKCIKSLHSAGADVNVKDKDGKTPLHIAAWTAKTASVKALLDIGADALAQDPEGRTALHLAAISWNPECVRLLASAVNNLELTDRNGLTALHYAAESGDHESVEHILRAGANSSPVNDKLLDTPLHMAAHGGSAECVRLLVEAKADVAARNVRGITALHYAVFSGDLECVRCLLRARAHVQERDAFGSTPLHWAVKGGRSHCIRILVEEGADVNETNGYSVTPLHLAALLDKAECVRQLLDAGADMNAHGSGCWTPLHFAAYEGCAESVKLLLDAGADALARDSRCRTPLHLAAIRSNDLCFILLLYSA